MGSDFHQLESVQRYYKTLRGKNPDG